MFYWLFYEQSVVWNVAFTIYFRNSRIPHIIFSELSFIRLKTQFSSLRHKVMPVAALCAVRLCSSSSEQQKSYERKNWKHILAGLLAGTGAVLAYGLHHHKVWNF